MKYDWNFCKGKINVNNTLIPIEGRIYRWLATRHAGAIPNKIS
jgi:hypothetical protein